MEKRQVRNTKRPDPPLLKFLEEKGQSGSSKSSPSWVRNPPPKKQKPNNGIRKYLDKVAAHSDISDSDESIQLLTPSRRKYYKKNAPGTAKGAVGKIKGKDSTPTNQTVSATIEILDSDSDDDAVPIVSTAMTTSNSQTPKGKEKKISNDVLQATLVPADTPPPRLSSKAASSETKQTSRTRSPQLSNQVILDSDSDNDPMPALPSSVPASKSSPTKEKDQKRSKDALQTSPVKTTTPSFSLKKVNSAETRYNTSTPELSNPVKESDVNFMIAMGFHHDDCTRALNDANNDAVLAVNILLNERL